MRSIWLIMFCLIWLNTYVFGQDGGVINLPSGGSTYVSCLQVQQEELVDLILSDNTGENSIWIVVDTANTIIQVINNPPIDISEIVEDEFYIYHIGYDDIQGVEAGAMLHDIMGSFGISNSVKVIKKQLTLPVIDTVSMPDLTQSCIGDQLSDIFIIPHTKSNASHHQWVAVDTFGVIRYLWTGDTINIEELSVDIYDLYLVGYEDNVKGLDVGLSWAEVSGCFDAAASSVPVRNTVIDGGKLTFANGKTIRSVCVGDNMSDVFSPIINDTIGVFRKWIIADKTGLIKAVPNFNSFNFEGVPADTYHIYNISYLGNVIGLSTGSNVSQLQGCFDLSNKLTLIASEGDTRGGLLTSSISSFCNGDGIVDRANLALFGADGDTTIIVISDMNDTILALCEMGMCDLELLPVADSFRLRALSISNGYNGLEVGNSIYEVEGCFSWSNVLSIKGNNVSGGKILDNQPVTICSADGISDEYMVNIQDQIGGNITTIIVQNDIIIHAVPSLEIDLDQNLSDTSYVYVVSSVGPLDGIQEGMMFSGIKGCLAISDSLVVLNSVGSPMVPTISMDTVDFCYQRGDTIEIKPNWQLTNDSSIHRYIVLADGAGRILSIGNEAAKYAGVSGAYKVYAIYAGPLVSGLYIDGDIAGLKGCYAISDGITVNVQRVSGGSLVSQSIDAGKICIIDGVYPLASFEALESEGDNEAYIVVDDFGNLALVYDFGVFDITADFPDRFKVYHITYNDIDNLFAGSNISKLEGCFSLSAPHDFEIQYLNTPEIQFADTPMDTLVLCGEDDISVAIVTDNVGIGEVYEVKDQKGNLLHVSHSNIIDISDIDEDTIYINQKLYAGDSASCHVISNIIVVISYIPAVTALSTSASLICVTPDKNPLIEVSVDDYKGDSLRYMLVNPLGDIVYFDNNANIGTAGLPSGRYQVSAIAYYGPIHVGSTVQSIEGCFAMSNTIDVDITYLNAGQTSFVNGRDSMVICLGQDSISIVVQGAISPNYTVIITDLDSIILGVSPNIELSLSELGTGAYLLWYEASKEPINIDMGTPLIIDENCSHLAIPIYLTIEESETDIPIIKVDSISNQCLDTLLVKRYHFSLRNPELEDIVWISTTPGGVIESVHTAMPIDVDASKSHLIYAIAYKTFPTLLAPGLDLSDLRTCFGLSNPYIVTPVRNEAGSVAYLDGSDHLNVCGIGLRRDTIYPTTNTRGFIRGMWVVTDTAGMVQDTFYKLPIYVDNLGSTQLLIYFMAYYDNRSLPIIDELISEIQGCYELSNPIMFTTSYIEAGSIMVNDTNYYTACIGGSDVQPLQYNISNAIGGGQSWVLTDTNDITLISLSTPPGNLSLLGSTHCKLYHLRYQLDQFGGILLGKHVNTFDGCYDISNNIYFVKEEVNGGMLVLPDSSRETIICVDDGIDEVINPLLTASQGSQRAWLVTNEIGEVISVGSQPPFNFEGQGEGQSFIWNVSVSGASVLPSLGDFISDLEGCSDISNPIRVRKKVGEGCLTNTLDATIDVHIYPNPASTTLHVLHNASTVDVAIYNQFGQRVLSNFGTFEMVDLSNLDIGMYYLRLITKDGTVHVHEFVIAK